MKNIYGKRIKIVNRMRIKNNNNNLKKVYIKLETKKKIMNNYYKLKILYKIKLINNIITKDNPYINNNNKIVIIFLIK